MQLYELSWNKCYYLQILSNPGLITHKPWPYKKCCCQSLRIPFIISNHPSVSSQCSVAGFTLYITWLDWKKLPKPLKQASQQVLNQIQVLKSPQVPLFHYFTKTRFRWISAIQCSFYSKSTLLCFNSFNAQPSQENWKSFSTRSETKIFHCIKICLLSCMQCLHLILQYNKHQYFTNNPLK